MEFKAKSKFNVGDKVYVVDWSSYQNFLEDFAPKIGTILSLKAKVDRRGKLSFVYNVQRAFFAAYCNKFYKTTKKETHDTIFKTQRAALNYAKPYKKFYLEKEVEGISRDLANLKDRDYRTLLYSKNGVFSQKYREWLGCERRVKGWIWEKKAKAKLSFFNAELAKLG